MKGGALKKEVESEHQWTQVNWTFNQSISEAFYGKTAQIQREKFFLNTLPP